MTTNSPERDRLMALESGTAHLREIMDIRHQQSLDCFAELKDRNRVQDQEQLQLTRDLTIQIEEIKEELWRGLKWLGGSLCAVILSVALKALGLL